MTFDLEKEKAATIKKLEAISKLSDDYARLKNSISYIDVVKLIEDNINYEAEKLKKYAQKHSIPFDINVDELVATVTLPLTKPPVYTSRPSMPFEPALGYRLVDTTEGVTYLYQGLGEWKALDEWESSNCEEEWESSDSW